MSPTMTEKQSPPNPTSGIEKILTNNKDLQIEVLWKKGNSLEDPNHAYTWGDTFRNRIREKGTIKYKDQVWNIIFGDFYEYKKNAWNPHSESENTKFTIENANPSCPYDRLVFSYLTNQCGIVLLSGFNDGYTWTKEKHEFVKALAHELGYSAILMTYCDDHEEGQEPFIKLFLAGSSKREWKLIGRCRNHRSENNIFTRINYLYTPRC